MKKDLKSKKKDLVREAEPAKRERPEPIRLDKDEPIRLDKDEPIRLDKDEPIRLDELAAEKALLDPLMAADLGDIEFSEAFFDNMHDKIMAKIETTEIQPAPKPWQKIRWQVYAKFAVGVTTTMICAVSVALAYSSMSKAKARTALNKNSNYERLLQAALESPDQFNTMVTASLGEGDFFVDVASQNSDHLSLGDLDGIMGLANKKN